MIKVLLVDDEPFIRQGLRILVDWEANGYEVVGEAGNGIEALDYLQKYHVDLVFADLKMPEMSGLELIQRVSETLSQDIRFVILTGFADFEYAKQAIKYHVAEYMLKPVEKEELLRILKKMNSDFEQEKIHRHISLRVQVMRVLNGKYGTKDFEEVSAKMRFSHEYQFISFEFNLHDVQFSKLTDEEKMQAQIDAMALMETLLGENYAHIAEIPDQNYKNYGVGLIFTEEFASESSYSPKEYLMYIQRKISGLKGYSVLVYVGAKVTELSKIMESYHSIRVARCLHNFSEEEQPIAAYERLYGQKKMAGLEKGLLDDLVVYIQDFQPDKIKELVEKFYLQLRKNAGVMDMIQANIYYLWYRLFELATKLDQELNQEEILQYISRESFERAALSGSAEELTVFVLEYAEYLSQIKNVESGNILDKVEEYLHDHYCENLSLKLLGEKFYINNVYLGQLFKKKYEISFREYMNQLRIDRAAQLLRDSNLRVYAIAEQVGFHNADYFINKFVQLMGTTPQQYRMKYGEMK